MKHLTQITIIAAVSLAGELLNYLIPLPIPGSIYGLILMLVLLLTKIIRTDHVKAVSDWLLSLMPVMFVGPTVGLIVSYDSFRSFLLPIVIIATVSTAVVMVVTGRFAQWLIHRSDRKEKHDAE